MRLTVKRVLDQMKARVLTSMVQDTSRLIVTSKTVTRARMTSAFLLKRQAEVNQVTVDIKRCPTVIHTGRRELQAAGFLPNESYKWQDSFGKVMAVRKVGVGCLHGDGGQACMASCSFLNV